MSKERKSKMNKREQKELQAKSIVEAMVKDLNHRFGWKLYIEMIHPRKSWESSRDFDALRISYPHPGGGVPNSSYCFAQIESTKHRPIKLTYANLLKSLLKFPMKFDFSKRLGYESIDLSKLYGDTIEKVQIALDLNAA